MEGETGAETVRRKEALMTETRSPPGIALPLGNNAIEVVDRNPVNQPAGSLAERLRVLTGFRDEKTGHRDTMERENGTEILTKEKASMTEILLGIALHPGNTAAE